MSAQRIAGQSARRGRAGSPGQAGPLDRPVYLARAFTVGLVATLGVGVGLVAWSAAGHLSTVLVHIGVAFFLALGLEPIVRRIAERTRRRWLGVLVVVAVFLGAATGLGWLLVPVVAEQAGKLVSEGPGILEGLSRHPWVKQAQEMLPGTLNPASLGEKLQEFASKPDTLGNAGSAVLAVGQVLAEFVTGLFVIFILTVYFMASFPGMKNLMRHLVPASRRGRFTAVSEEIFSSVGRFVLGKGALALVNAAFATVLMLLLGAPVPIILGVVAFFGALIPVVGQPVAMAVLILATLSVSPVKALIAAVALFAYDTLDDYVFNPKVMNTAVEIPGSASVIAVLAGGSIGSAGGIGGAVLGALVAIPVAGAVAIIIRRVVIPRQDRS